MHHHHHHHKHTTMIDSTELVKGPMVYIEANRIETLHMILMLTSIVMSTITLTVPLYSPSISLSISLSYLHTHTHTQTHITHTLDEAVEVGPRFDDARYVTWVEGDAIGPGKTTRMVQRHWAGDCNYDNDDNDANDNNDNDDDNVNGLGYGLGVVDYSLANSIRL